MRIILLTLLSLAVTAGAEPVYVSTQEGRLAVFDPTHWSLTGQFEGLPPSAPVAFENNAVQAWTPARNGSFLQGLNLENVEALSTYLPVTHTPVDVAWIRPDGPLAFISKNNTTIEFVNPTDPAATYPSLALGGQPSAFAYPPQADQLAVILEDPPRLLLVTENKILKTIPLAYPVWDVKFSHDGGRVAASHPDHGLVTLIDLKGRELARRLEVGSSPRGLALSPDGTTLWVAHQFDSSGGVTMIDVAANSISGKRRVVGETWGLRYIPEEGAREPRLVVAAHIPQLSNAGMLYALSTDLSDVVATQPLTGKPTRFYSPPFTGLWTAPTPTPTISPTPIPVDIVSPQDKRPGLLKGGFSGRLLLKKNSQPLQGAVGIARAVNRRGRQYEGEIFADGTFRIAGMPWGTYQLVFEVEGYKRKVIPEQLLAFSSNTSLDVELILVSKEKQ